MDVTDKNEPTSFLYLVFIETFNAPSISLSIGKHNIEMPDWNILIGDMNIGELEFANPLTSINERTFDTVLTNPLRRLYNGLAT